MRPYSQQILLALEKHGRLNCRQLAGKISHEFSKTKDLVGYMRQNGKLVTDGTVDDMVSYSLSYKGRAEAARLHDGVPDGATLTRQVGRSSASVGEPSADMETQQAAKAGRSTRPKTAPNSLEDVMHNVNDRTYPGHVGEAEPRPTPAAAVSPNTPINEIGRASCRERVGKYV